MESPTTHFLTFVRLVLPPLFALGFNALSLAQNLIRLEPGEHTFVRDMTIQGDCLNGGAITYQTNGFELFTGKPLPIFTGSGTFTGLFGLRSSSPFLLLDALDWSGKPTVIRFDFTPISALADPRDSVFSYSAIVENILPSGFARLAFDYYAGFCIVTVSPSGVRSGGAFFNPAGSRWVGYQYAPYESPPQSVPFSESMSLVVATLVSVIGLVKLRIKPAPTPPQSPAPRRYTSYTARIARRLHAID